MKRETTTNLLTENASNIWENPFVQVSADKAYIAVNLLHKYCKTLRSCNRCAISELTGCNGKNCDVPGEWGNVNQKEEMKENEF